MPFKRRLATCLIRGACLLAALGAPLAISLTMPVPQTGECIWDRGFDVLAGTTNFYQQNVTQKKLLILFDSLLIDLSVVGLCLLYAFWNRTISLVPSLGCFYLFRLLILQILEWPIPEVYLWEDPGFFSLTIFYEPRADMFFSGHCGLLSLLLLDSAFNRRFIFAAVEILLLTYTAFMLVVTHTHFTNDIVIGVLVGFVTASFGFKFRYSFAFGYLHVQGFLCACVGRFVNWLISLCCKPKQKQDVETKDEIKKVSHFADTDSEMKTIVASSPALNISAV